MNKGMDTLQTVGMELHTLGNSLGIAHDLMVYQPQNLVVFLTEQRLDDERLNKLYAVALRHDCRMVVQSGQYHRAVLEVGLMNPAELARRFDEWKNSPAGEACVQAELTT